MTKAATAAVTTVDAAQVRPRSRRTMRWWSGMKVTTRTDPQIMPGKNGLRTSHEHHDTAARRATKRTVPMSRGMGGASTTAARVSRAHERTAFFLDSPEPVELPFAQGGDWT